MSRWLRNVNALLENLDGRVEETVEERYGGGDEDQDVVIGEDGTLLDKEGQGVDDILAKRGLLDEEEEDIEFQAEGGAAVAGGEEGGDVVDFGGKDGDAGGVKDDGVGLPKDGAEEDEKEQLIKDGKGIKSEGDSAKRGESGIDSELEEVINFDSTSNTQETDAGKEEKLFSSQSSDAIDVTKESSKNKDTGNEKESTSEMPGPDQNQTDNALSDPEKSEKTPASYNLSSKPVKPAAPASTSSSQHLSTPTETPAAPTSSNLNVASSQSNATAALNAANAKELRKLRRHVLQLNSSLESAEREIEAQRLELDRAASRMERDRSRHKQEKEAGEVSHKAELAALTASHEKTLAELKERNDDKLKDMEGRIRRAEQQRAKEGGERDAELAEALERERSALATTGRLQEENTTINERITSLSTEISRLETRLEHATSQMELASERERNAEEQLDKALSLHARQLGVRQKREAELEQMVADLGAALVVAKGKVEATMKEGGGVGINEGSSSNEGKTVDGDGAADLKARLEDSQDEIETLRAQLFLERQRCATLHTELQDLSKEQADELSGAHARQRQYERKISDLTTMVAKLQSSTRSLRKGDSSTVGDGDLDTVDINEDSTTGMELQYSGDEKKETDHLRKQIASLSEKIVEQQSRIDRGRGEISTLKNRLKSAEVRAESAEKSLEVANQRLMLIDTPGESGYAMSGMSSADEDMSPTSIPLGHATSPTGRRVARTKRRPMGASSSAQRRGFQKSSRIESIRSALGLHTGRIPTGGFQETFAQLLDAFDTIAIDLGAHFRHFPLSRLAFIFYMIILHLWAFFLLVYHAHAQGTGGGDHYGPEALLRSYRHMEQVPRAKTP